MEISVEFSGVRYKADLAKGFDLSLPVDQSSTLNAYFAPKVLMEPYRSGDWIGEVASGGAVNYRNVFFNPHGHGTHTECVGHIDNAVHSVNKHFRQFHSFAQLVSLQPRELPIGDRMITLEQVRGLKFMRTDSIIIRTLPNDPAKRQINYSGSNPPYLQAEAVAHLVSNGCRHLILDLPSIDRESDEGKLLGHRAFWNYPAKPRMDCTVTELAFIPNEAEDGLYLLNLQVAPFENDAAPSRPLIFKLSQI